MATQTDLLPVEFLRAEVRPSVRPGCSVACAGGKGIQCQHAFFILFTNLASFGESGETLAAAPLFPPLQGAAALEQDGVLAQPYIFQPQIFACSRAIHVLGLARRQETPDL